MDTENKTIKNQLIESIDLLNSMEPVVSLVMPKFKNFRKSDLAKQIDNEFKKIGSQVERKNFGSIMLSYKEISKSLRYLSTDGEFLSLLTVPYVIKRGEVIDWHKAHKNRNVDSITFAAPVEINGIRGNVGVVVQRDESTNRYKTHRIITPEGNVYKI